LRRGRDGLHGGIEGGLVGLRGFVEAADLAHVLQRSRADFIRAGGRLEMVEGLDVAAHGRLLLRKCGLDFYSVECFFGIASRAGTILDSLLIKWIICV
jgi:hypothetical protein